MEQNHIKKLIESAFSVRGLAYAPYSGFSVGAALLAADGRVFCGCNIENAAFSPSICAERAAISQAISAGCREFAAVAVCGGPMERGAGEIDYCYPCGLCRQVLMEFCPPELPVYVARSAGDYRRHRLVDLLPHAFSAADLSGGGVGGCGC
ncbi:MAG: cytidine deaminase [Clostridia bacterium]|nr:cytidine deaminase [Clostridia bacterium]